MASGTMHKEYTVHSVTKDITIATPGDAILFSGSYKHVLSVYTNDSGGRYLFYTPYWYNGNTAVKCWSFATSAPSYATNGTVNVTIYYLD